MNEKKPKIETSTMIAFASLALSAILAWNSFAEAASGSHDILERRVCSLEVTVYKKACMQ
jgi:hypothetical protein